MSQANQTRKVQDRTLKTQEAILESALIEFAEFGFDGASLRRVGTRADVNHRLIQHHFGNKESLWQSVAKHIFAIYQQRLESRTQGLQGVKADEYYRLTFKEFILFSADYPAFNRFMLQANLNAERMSWLIEHVLPTAKNTEVTLIREAQDAGVFIDGDPTRLYYIFIAAATSIFSFNSEFQQVTGKDPFSADVIDQHIDTVLQIFGVTPAAVQNSNKRKPRK